MSITEYHIPVLLDESVSALNIKEDGIYVDATMGGAGHTREILRRLGKKGRLIAFDRDADAIANAPDDKRLTIVRNNFRFIENYMMLFGIKADGILADLGVSSHQFDTGERGFSFRFEAGLDMRMNRNGGRTAADVIAACTEGELAEILKNYGEVEKSGKMASLICKYRETHPIENTTDLYEAIKDALPKNAEHKFLAKIYQALRIEVNGEIRSLEEFLTGCGKTLKTGGRLSVITYHSIEDRIVKNYMKYGNIGGSAEKDLFGNTAKEYEIITRKPVLPTEEEIHGNTRARSAKLRVAEKI